MDKYETAQAGDSAAGGALIQEIRQAIAANGGWLAFDAFMQMALYEPGLGYYSHARRKIGLMPAAGSPVPGDAQDEAAEGSDFVTAPEISPLFGRTLARQIGEALAHTGTDVVYEFGAGNGALAQHVLQTLGESVRRYCIIDVSQSLRSLQAGRLAAYGDRVQWLDALPETLEGVLLGNEVLDAMPVKLLAHRSGQWFERGVACTSQGGLVWEDRATGQEIPDELEPAQDDDYVTEVHPWAEAFIRTTSQRLRRGAALWIDYGFCAREYYHAQRHMGTLVAHSRHRVDEQVLQEVGEKDITSHVNFTGIAVVAQQAGLQVLGYTTQARFLINCGIGTLLDAAPLKERVMAAKLLHEHEMGELFKVIMLGAGAFWEPVGFRIGDRTHTL